MNFKKLKSKGSIIVKDGGLNVKGIGKILADANINLILDNIYELFPNASCELNYNNIFELLVAVVLSAQTTDKKLYSASGILHNAFLFTVNPMPCHTCSHQKRNEFMENGRS